MPVVNELDGATYFSKLDLRFWYHQILVKQDDGRHKTTFRTHHDHYEWLMKAFGQ